MEANGPRPNDESLPFGRASLALAEAIKAGDVGAAERCFTPDACLITPDATAVSGPLEVRGILAQLIDAGTVIEVETGSLVRAGELALSSERLHFRSRGLPYRQTFAANMVLRRQGGDWRVAIAAPWGWGS